MHRKLEDLSEKFIYFEKRDKCQGTHVNWLVLGLQNLDGCQLLNCYHTSFCCWSWRSCDAPWNKAALWFFHVIYWWIRGGQDNKLASQKNQLHRVTEDRMSFILLFTFMAWRYVDIDAEGQFCSIYKTSLIWFK